MNKRLRVELTKEAEKDLKRLRPWTEQALREILSLEDNPYRGHTLSGTLRGTRSLEFNLKGSGAYRAVYFITHEDAVCIVFIIGPHENLYKHASRRLATLKLHQPDEQ
jgi:mRNA-degrading endonuclease RelE of RelBE toxin-antitoxin system